MSTIFKILGSYFALRLVLNQAANTILSQITYNFKEAKVIRFKLFGSTKVKFTYVVTNGTDIPVTIERLYGVVAAGNVRATIDAPQTLRIQAKGTAIISFTIEVNNDDFLFELSNIIERGGLPELYLEGNATIRLTEGKTVNLPISQKIPVVLS